MVVSLSSPAAAPAEARQLAGTAPSHRPLAGVAIFDGGLNEAARLCLEWIDSGDGGRVATANLDFLALAGRDPDLRTLLADSHLVVADGAPVAWLARLGGGPQTRRVGGVDLVSRLLEESRQRGGLRVALYGGLPDVSEAARTLIERRYPHVNVVSAISPPFEERTPQDHALDRERIRDAAPDLVLVALGCPKQERLIADYYEAAPGAVWIGVGGTLDILAGRRWRAPRLFQRLGLEWAARLAQEPGRLWKRYFLRDLPTLARLAPICLWSMLARRVRIRRLTA